MSNICGRCTDLAEFQHRPGFEYCLEHYAGALEEDVINYKKEIERLKKENEKLKRLMLLTDPSVSNIVVGETQIIQWNEFIKAFPEYNTEVKY